MSKMCYCCRHCCCITADKTVASFFISVMVVIIIYTIAFIIIYTNRIESYIEFINLFYSIIAVLFYRFRHKLFYSKIFRIFFGIYFLLGLALTTIDIKLNIHRIIKKYDNFKFNLIFLLIRCVITAFNFYTYYSAYSVYGSRENSFTELDEEELKEFKNYKLETIGNLRDKNNGGTCSYSGENSSETERRVKNNKIILPKIDIKTE